MIYSYFSCICSHDHKISNTCRNLNLDQKVPIGTLEAAAVTTISQQTLSHHEEKAGCEQREKKELLSNIIHGMQIIKQYSFIL